jgi:hypothetical protein
MNAEGKVLTRLKKCCLTDRNLDRRLEMYPENDKTLRDMTMTRQAKASKLSRYIRMAERYCRRSAKGISAT